MQYNIPLSIYSFQSLYKVSLYAEWHENAKYFYLPPGHEHYWLLSELAKQVPNNSTVLDVGTYLGYSALALSTNENINVVTVDIVDEIQYNLPKQKENIKFLIEEDIISKLPKYINCPIIMLDTNHEGEFEELFVQKLIDLNYKGILICDDIHLNEPMKKFWSNISLRKQDISNLGHWSGTGIIFFDASTELIIS